MTWQRTGVHKGRRLTQAQQKAAKQLIAMQALSQRPRGRWPRSAAYAIEVIGYWPDRRLGDSDRLVSLVMDALEGVAYGADRQVRAQCSAMLVDAMNPRTEVTLVAYDEATAQPVLTIELRSLPPSGGSG